MPPRCCSFFLDIIFRWFGRLFAGFRVTLGFCSSLFMIVSSFDRTFVPRFRVATVLGARPPIVRAMTRTRSRFGLVGSRSRTWVATVPGATAWSGSPVARSGARCPRSGARVPAGAGTGPRVGSRPGSGARVRSSTRSGSASRIGVIPVTISRFFSQFLEISRKQQQYRYQQVKLDGNNESGPSMYFYIFIKRPYRGILQT